MALIGGAEVAICVGKQSAATTPATTVYMLTLTEWEDSDARLVWRNEPEIGGSLYTGKSAIVLGARPRFRMGGIVRLGTMGYVLQMAGVLKGANSGDGTTTPFVGPFVPVAASANWPYYTIAMIYSSGIKKMYVGARLTKLQIQIRPGQPPRWSAEGVAIDIRNTALTATTPPGLDLIPSPAEAIAAASLKIFGANTVDILALDLMLDSNFDDDNQPIGGLLSQDVVPTRLVCNYEGNLQLSDAYYNQLNWGTVGGTALATAMATGQLTAKINTFDNAGPSSPYTTPGFIQFDSAVVKYHMGQSLSISPERQALIPYAAIPADLTVSIMNGTTLATY